MPGAMGLVIKMALSITIFQQFNEAHAYLSYPYFTAFNPQQVQTENLARRHRLDEAPSNNHPLNAPKRPIVIQNRRAQFGVGPARDELPYFTAFNPQQVQTENLARRHRIDEAQ